MLYRSVKKVCSLFTSSKKQNPLVRFFNTHSKPEQQAAVLDICSYLVVLQASVLAGANWERCSLKPGWFADVTTAQTLDGTKEALCAFWQSLPVSPSLSPIHRQALGKANKCVWLCWSILDKMSAWGWILFRAVIISGVLECNECMSAVFLSGIQDGQRWYRALRGKTRQHGLHGEGLATFSHTNTHTHSKTNTVTHNSALWTWHCASRTRCTDETHRFQLMWSQKSKRWSDMQLKTLISCKLNDFQTFYLTSMWNSRIGSTSLACFW